MKQLTLITVALLSLNNVAQAKIQNELAPHLPQRGELTEFQKSISGDIKVTKDNFLAAEADRYLAEQQELAPVNQWEHKFKLLTYKTQSVVRQNRDTLYSKSIVDVSKGATFSLEKSNQYQTLHVVDSNHREIFVLYSDSDKRSITIDKSDLSEGAGEHVYVVLRTAMPNGESKKAYEVANKLQRSAKISAKSNKPYITKGFNQESREATRLALEPEILKMDLTKAFGTVGSKHVTKHDSTIGIGIGWGGFSTPHAHYKILLAEDRSGTCQTMTFDAPKFKKGGFFSITTYGPDAYIHADKYAINMNEMEQDKDGRYTVNFNCEGRKNNLEVMKNWTGALRMYRPLDKASIVEFAKGVESPHSAK